ncbi:MAG: hypothetical protein CVV47_09255 [Spirochaetae bacterium HGW-Spirochaetae-3]|jgi:predicted amidohydrolase|nr:MAG: hypothetical protein CVV47_09255 [Spirochaetae bacterium HGW-Spirochaetae-3]
MYELLIRNGTVVDPASGVNGAADVAIANGRVAAVGSLGDVPAERVVDASGCYVTPGLVDFHLHLAPLAEIGVPGEAACFPSGVTTAVDCGSAGAGTWEGHRPVVAASRLRVRAFLHVCSAGLATGRFTENADPRYYDEEKIGRLLREYPGELVGLKVRQGAEIVGDLGLEPLRRTVELGEKYGVPVMVHCSNSPAPLPEMLDLLRPGDILTHAYQDKGHSLLDEGGRVCEAAWKARERGVVFDVANANVHFSFEVARRALAEGFLPDTISTDLTTRSLYRRPAVFNLAFVLSKYLCLGMDLGQVVARCTEYPARLLGMAGEIGCLATGARGDVAVFREIRRETEFGDRAGVLFRGDRLLRPVLTVKGGDVVYRDIEF